jgi:hypothetical protein
MNENATRDEPGSDELMTDEERAQVQRRADLEAAAVVEEERKTAAQPDDGPG